MSKQANNEVAEKFNAEISKAADASAAGKTVRMLNHLKAAQYLALGQMRSGGLDFAPYKRWEAKLLWCYACRAAALDQHELH